MKIYKSIGSKERFAEIFQGVNKVKLNEGFGQSYNPQAVLEMAYEGLKNGTLNIVHSNSQGEGEQSFIELVCKDKQGNNITFTFKTLSSADDQEGVYNIDKTIMTNFSFDDQTGEDSVEMDENALKQFNAQHANDLFDAVKGYIDVEEPEPAIDELYEDAIRKIDSSPFGKDSFDKLQTGKAYADEKPVNPAIRVKSPELDKFVKEDANSLLHFSQAARDAGSSFKTKLAVSYQQVLANTLKDIGITIQNIEDIDNQNYRITAEYQGKPRTFTINSAKFDNAAKVRELLKKALKIGVEESLYEEEAKIAGDYPDPMGKKFKPKEHYPKKKRKPQTSVKLSEQDDENNYEETPDSNIPIDKRAKKTAQSDIHKEFNRTVPYDTKFNAGMDEKKDEPLTGDDNVTDTEFMDTERQGLQGSENDVKSDTTNDVNPETEMGTEKDVEAGTAEPETNDGMEHEPVSDEIEKIAQDKEEAGEMIAGGKGEGKSPLEFTPDQILKGMRVEMEHTDDPMVSLEITLDHLTEDPEYYGNDEENPELMAQANAAADVNKPESEEDDKEMTNMLLGFKPHNVGDEIEGDEEIEKNPEPEVEPEKKEDELGEAEAGFEEYQGNIGDRYADEDGNEFVVHNKVKGGVTLKTQSGEIEVATSDLKFYKKLNEGETPKKIITEEQIKTAKRTLSNSKVPTGMTKKEAVQILMNNNLKKIL
jgi:hypothetical protein